MGIIYNMDCIQGAELHIADQSADLIVTDPPFNLAFGGTTQTKTKKPRFQVFANDKLSQRDYQRFSINWLRQAFRILKPGRHIYVFIDWRMYPLMVLWMRKIGFVIKNCIVWNKMNMGMGWQYRFQHEFCIFAVKQDKQVRKINSRSQSDVWSIPRIQGNKTVHPTEKPFELMEKIVLNSSSEGEKVVDFFVGSGPVPVACYKTGRRFTGFELDPGYYELATKRIEELLHKG